jgi:hypothetical protein
MGEQCKYLTLFGAAELTVAGDMIINPGQVLNISDNAEIIVAGDWVNSGTFNPGAGTVTFNGTEDGWISDGPPPASYISGFEYSSFTQGMTAISGGTPGPTGDDAHSDVSIGFTFNYLGVDYTEVRINTNGWLSLNLSGDDNTSHENASLFNASSPTTAIAPWWDNLLADASAVISYLTEGTAPNRIFTVEWNNILSFNTDATARLNFQVKLYESTNIIEFHYGGLTAGTHHPDEGASMGINDSQGGPGNFMEAVNGTTHMMVSCIKSDPNWPANNVRFTPPVTNPMETFYQVTVTKTPGKLRLDRDVTVTGVQ